MEQTNSRKLIIGIEANDSFSSFIFDVSIESALTMAENQKRELEYVLQENVNTIKKLTPECDKTDYALAACSGVLCGLIDVFLVGTPNESTLNSISDKWFEEKTKGFARLTGWDDDGSIKSAIKHLERKFKVPYDQTGMGESGLDILDLTPSNHHFKSLAHNLSLLGLFFSILDQFGDDKGNVAHFVTGGDLVVWSVPGERIELRGKTLPAKLFCGFVNWIGHLISDMSGSSSSKHRGMGIPSPLWTWSNDVIAIKRELNIDVSKFDQSLNELALNIYEKGYDARFQTTQAIPVFINEMLVRVFYSLRRMCQYFTKCEKGSFNFKSLYENCEPFTNSTVKRMLTVAHGTFCLVDLGDATLQGFVKGAGSFNVEEFFLRVNLPGVGRFAISLYGEVDRSIEKTIIFKENEYLEKKKIIIDDYIYGLHVLSEKYNDETMLTFINDLNQSDIYKQAFIKSAILAEKWGAPEDKILKDKNDIDTYFNGGSK